MYSEVWNLGAVHPVDPSLFHVEDDNHDADHTQQEGAADHDDVQVLVGRDNEGDVPLVLLLSLVPFVHDDQLSVWYYRRLYVLLQTVIQERRRVERLNVVITPAHTQVNVRGKQRVMRLLR